MRGNSVKDLGYAPRDSEPEQVVVHGPVSGVSRDITRRTDGETLLPGDRRQVGRELRPSEQGGEPDYHHAGDVIDLFSVMEALASASDDNTDPGPDQFEFGVEVRSLIRVRGRAVGARRETRRIAPSLTAAPPRAPRRQVRLAPARRRPHPSGTR